MTNSKYIAILTLIILLTSCNKDDHFQNSSTQYLFQKELTIHDEKGNSIDLIVYTNSEEELKDHTSDIFILNTTNEKFSNLSTSTEIPDHQDSDLIIEDEIFILVTNHNLLSDVTGFSVRSKFDAFLPTESSTRASSTHKYYAYGADGVKGAKVNYLTESCIDEKMKVKLSKKTWPFSLIWTTLGSDILYYAGGSWSYSSSTFHYRYKLKIKLIDKCDGTSSFSHTWLT